MFKVKERILEGWSDVEVSIRNKEFVIEVATVDNEIDLNIMSKDEYRETYGRNVGE